MSRRLRRPRVGISRCLLGDAVRYDGTHRLAGGVVEALDPHVEWVPVCPEVEVGMGVPREAIRLVLRADGVPSAAHRVRLLGVSSGADWTDRMHEWARERVRALVALDLAGFVLKARSPSCGIDDVDVEGVDGGLAGRGLFAQALLEVLPHLVVADESRLADARARDAFLRRITLADRSDTNT